MKMNPKQLLAVLVGASAFAGVVQAAPVTVQNYSFEQPALAAGGTDSGHPGWASFNGGYQQIYDQNNNENFNINGDGTLVAPGDGYQYFSVNGGGAGGPGGIYQDVSGLLPNTTYTLTVAVGRRSSFDGVSNFKLVNGIDNTGTVLAQTNVDITTLTSGTFTDFTIVYTTGPVVSGDLTVVLQSTTGVQADYDNVRLDAALPSFGAPVTVVNNSFEDPALGSGNQSYTFPGWTGVNTGVGVAQADWSAHYNGGIMPAPGDGLQLAFINNTGALYQDVGPLQPLQTYTMLVAVGADPNTSWGEGWGRIVLVNGTDNTGTVLASAAVNNIGEAGYFRDYSVTFTTPATVSGDLTLLLQTTNAIQIVYDNVRLYKATPVLPPTVGATSLSQYSTYPGALVTVSAVASGLGTLEYQVQYDNGSGGTTWAPVSSYSTNSSYVENTAGFPLGNYEFRVVVTNVYGAATSTPAILSVGNVGPTLVQSPIPVNENLVVSQTAQMASVFNSTLPITYQWQINRNDGNGLVNVTNGTFNSSLLIITNLQSTDAGTYWVIATHTYGSTTNSAPVSLTVANLPSPDIFGNLVFIDNENNSGAFTPTFGMPPGSLIDGQLPVDQAGSFSGPGYDSTGGNITNLTSAQAIIAGNKALMCSVGNGGGSGQYVTYNLNTNASPNGYNLTSIVAFGGWSDYGRDEVTADVYYSTVTDPTTFVQCAFYDNIPNAAFSPPVNWVVVQPSTGYLATNVAAVKFSFLPNELGGAVQNGYVGLFQLGVYGRAIQPPSISITKVGSNIILNWPSGTLYSASNISGPWIQVPSATSPFTVAPIQPRMFYRLQ